LDKAIPEEEDLISQQGQGFSMERENLWKETSRRRTQGEKIKATRSGEGCRGGGISCLHGKAVPVKDLSGEVLIL